MNSKKIERHLLDCAKFCDRVGAHPNDAVEVEWTGIAEPLS